jgi:hypothetical protein
MEIEIGDFRLPGVKCLWGYGNYAGNDLREPLQVPEVRNNVGGLVVCIVR